MTSFLTNGDNEKNHLHALKDNLLLHNEAYFAVAFFKYSGLELLALPIQEFLAKGGHIHIVAGQNFALTEPKALHEINRIVKSYPSSKLYLAKASISDKIFHPKLYLFKSNTDCCIISGSANITQGGLLNNKEVSIIANSNSDDKLWLDAKKYFDDLIKPENADEASLLVIKKYETFFEQQKQHNKKSKAIPSISKAQLKFNYENLLKYYSEYNNEQSRQYLKNKFASYETAKEVLNQIADDEKLTEIAFKSLLDRLAVGRKRLWHSGSLHRKIGLVYKHYREFQHLVRFIRQSKNLPPSIVFEKAKNHVRNISGAAENYIAEIMMTYNPDEFANLNSNPIKVLRQAAGVHMKAHSSSFSGKDYEEYCELVKEISSELGLNGMLEADSFFNDIYWRI